MIRVTVLYFGGLKEALGCSSEQLDLELELEAPLGRAYAVLCGRHPRLPGLMASVRLAVNEEFVPGMGTAAVAAGPALAHGDVVAFIPPVTGG